MNCSIRKKLIYISMFLFCITYLFLPIQELFAQETNDSEIDYKLVERFSEESLLVDIEGTKLDTENYIKENYQKNEVNNLTDTLSIENSEDGSKLFEENYDEIFFSIDVGEYLEVRGTEIFSIEISTNQLIDAFRIIVPHGTEFSFDNEEKRNLIEIYEDGSTLWYIVLHEKSNFFRTTLSLIESGQISVEDPKGEVHSAFLYVNTGQASRRTEMMSEETARTTVVVTTWANFRTAWNNNNRTVIVINSAIPFGTTSLSTRSSGVTIHGSGGLLRSETAQILSWASGVTVQFGLGGGIFTVEGFGFSGGTLSIEGQTRINTSSPINLNILNLNAIVQGETITTRSSISVHTLNITLGVIQSSQTIIASNVNLISGYNIRNTDGLTALTANTVNLFSTARGLMTWDLSNTTSVATRGWENLEATFSNYSISRSSDVSFNDETFQLINSRWIKGYGSAGGGSPPPSVEMTLDLVASPDAGGIPTATDTSLSPGDTTIINANPNSGYRFVRWEIITGAGSIIEDETSPETKFTMGSEDALVRAVYEEESIQEDTLTLEASPAEGGNPDYIDQTIDVGTVASIQANPNNGFTFLRWEIVSDNGAYLLFGNTSENALLVLGKGETIVRAIYEEELRELNPVDPLDPEVEVDPENNPKLPEDQGLFSIDFVSSFNFGTQIISVQDKTYYAQPQRLLNADGSVNAIEERPNYVQISDRRSETDRGNGWQLAVTQNRQFTGEQNQELSGAQLQFTNQQLVSIQNSGFPTLQEEGVVELTPGAKQVLVSAQGDSGIGTWIYRFGDRETADESVALMVPQGANPEATTYTTTLTWELSSVPGN